MYLLALASFFIFLFSACENDMNTIRNLKLPDKTGPTEIIHDVEMLYSDSFSVKMQVKAPLMLRFNPISEITEAFPEGAEVFFYDKNLQQMSYLRASEGRRINIEKEDERGRKYKVPAIEALGDVILVSSNNDTLKTEQLIWYENPVKNKSGEMIHVQSNKFVTIIREEEIIYGYGFEADQDFKNWRILSPTGSFKVEKVENDFRD